MLDRIGFYTLTDARVAQLSPSSPMWRCELILTDRCNFRCGYCRGLKSDLQGDMEFSFAASILRQWAQTGLKNVRFSGGEPTLYVPLIDLVQLCRDDLDVERVAISSNGSATRKFYQQLIDAGANDFSISLDACCAGDCAIMAGVSNKNLFRRITDNIKFLSEQVYTTVGIVLTPYNLQSTKDTIDLAHNLGVHDIRIIPSAQWDGNLASAVEEITNGMLAEHKILKYRIENIKKGRHVRGIRSEDSSRCYLPIDDSAIVGNYHFPCIIYLREGGEPIGKVGTMMREERIEWSRIHNTHHDPICAQNCLDVCIDYNNKVRDKHSGIKPG